MRSIWSYAGLMLALVLAAVLIVPGFLDWSRYAGVIEAQAEAITGRDVTIAGDVRISLLPSPKLTLGRMTIANAADAQAPHMAEIEGMSAELSVGSLFRGDLYVSRLSLRSPRLWLEETIEGRGNWVFQNGAPGALPDEGAQAADPDVPDTLPPVMVEEIEILGGQISLRNLGIGTDFEITEIDALVGASSLSGPYKARGRASIAGEPSEFMVTLDEIAADKAFPANVSLTFKDAEAAFSGIVTGWGADVRFDGAVTAGVAAGLTPALGALTAGQSVSLSAGVVATPGGVDFRDVEAKAGAVTLAGSISATAGASFAVDVDAVLNRADLTGFDTAGLPLTVSSVSGAIEQAIELVPTGNYRIAIEDVRLPSARLSALELQAEAGGDTISLSSLKTVLPGGARMSAVGAVSTGGEGPYFSGDVSVDGGRPSELIGWLNGGSVPDYLSGQPLESLTANGSVFLTPARISLDRLSVSLDGGKIAGQLATSFDERPQVDVALEIEALALPAGGLPLVSRVVPGRAIDLGIDGTVDLDVGALDVGPVHVENVSLQLEAAGPEIAVRELLFQSAQGASATLSGQSSDAQGQYQATLTAPTVASLEGLVPLPESSREGLSSLSMSGQVQWPSDAALEGAVGGAAETVDISVLARAGDVRFDTEGRFAPGPEGNADARFSMTTTFEADHWQKLVRAGTAMAGLYGVAGEDAEEADLPELPPVAADTPQTVTAVVEGGFDVPIALAVQASSAGLTGTVAGKLDLASPDPAYAFDFSLDTSLAGAVAQAAGHHLSGIDTADLKGGIAYDGSGYDLNGVAVRIEGADGTLDLDVSGRLSPAEERPSGTLTVTTREVDIALVHGLLTGAYVHAPAEPRPEEAQSDISSYWSADLLDAGWLGLADIEFAVDGGGVMVGPVQVDQLQLSGMVNKQVLTMADARALVFGGEVRGALSVTASRGVSLETSIAGTGIDVGSVSEQLGLGMFGTGEGAFDITLAGNGLSALALVSSLKGEGSFEVEKGTLSGVDLAALSDGLLQLERAADFAPLADATLTSGATPYEDISGRVAVTAGVMRAPDITLVTEAATGKASAFADIGRTALDVETAFTLKQPEGAPAASIVVAGDFQAPERSINTVELEAFAGRRLLQRDIDALGDGASNEVRVILDLQEEGEAPSATP